MRILTAIALFDEVDLDLYRSNEISEWLARPGQADGYRLMYDCMISVLQVSYLIDATVRDGYFL